MGTSNLSAGPGAVSGAAARRRNARKASKTPPSDSACARREEERSNAIRRVVPSDPWYWACQSAFERKLAKVGAVDPVVELAKRGVFPPGPGRAGGTSACHTPMVACQSRACTARRGRLADKREVHKLYPFYAAQAEQRSISDVEVYGVDRVTGQARSIQLRAADRRDAYRQAKVAGIEPTTLKVLRLGRRLRLCDDCRIALDQARRSREAANEARAAGEKTPRDISGRIVVEMKPEETAHQLAMEQLRVYGVQVEEAKMEPEDEASLKAEVAGYLALAGGTTVVMNFGFEAGAGRKSK